MFTPYHPGGTFTPPMPAFHYVPQPMAAGPAPVFVTPHAPTYNLPSPGVFVPAPLPPTPYFGSVVWTPQPAIPATLAVPVVNVVPPVQPVLPAHPVSPLTPFQAMHLSGGYPFPGCDSNLTSWPPTQRTSSVHIAPWLCPNNEDVDTPIVHWDIRKAPTFAYRLTGRGNPVPLPDDRQAWLGKVVFPDSAAREILIAVCQGEAQHEIILIPVRSQPGVTTRDLFDAIYDYFQQPLSDAEYEAFCRRELDGPSILYTAARKRISIEGGLLEANWRRGYKRVDMLGAETQWFGAWLKVDLQQNCWTLQAGLVRRLGHLR